MHAFAAIMLDRTPLHCAQYVFLNVVPFAHTGCHPLDSQALLYCWMHGAEPEQLRMWSGRGAHTPWVTVNLPLQNAQNVFLYVMRSVEEQTGFLSLLEQLPAYCDVCVCECVCVCV